MHKVRISAGDIFYWTNHVVGIDLDKFSTAVQSSSGQEKAGTAGTRNSLNTRYSLTCREQSTSLPSIYFKIKIF